jgi:FMN phosphatase YigB (HAD superfamily)
MLELERDPIIHITNEKLRSLGIRALLFDLDDTLIDTNSVFKRNMKSFSEAVATSLGIDSEDVGRRLQELNLDEYQRHGIDPKKWEVVLQRLGDELGNVELIFQNKHHIDNIYFEEPKLFPGVNALLSGLQSGNFLLGQVTHAETEWSLRKNDQAGITHYFDVIVTASVHESKSEKHWLQGMKALGVTPQECIITGDNLNGDIVPAISLGARAISLTSPWAAFREGELPSEAVKITKIADFWDAVLKLR